MANYATLKAAIQQVIKTNGNEEITGALLQQSLLAMINSLGGYYQFAGIATPSTNPGTPDQNVFYLASTAGTYSNFGSIVVNENEAVILKYNGTWSKDSSGFATSEKVSQLEAKVDDITNDPGTPISVDTTASGWKLMGNGLCSSDANARLKKYRVTAGDTIYLKLSADNPGVYQFQSAGSVPSSGTNANLVGTPVSVAVNGFVTVPTGATFLIVSENNGNTYNEVKTAVSYSLAEQDEKITELDQEVNGTVIPFVPEWQETAKYIKTDGSVAPGVGWYISVPFVLKAGKTVSVKTQGYSACIIAEVIGGSYSPLVIAPYGSSGLNTYEYTADNDITIALSVKYGLGDVVMSTYMPNIRDMVGTMDAEFETIGTGATISESESVSDGDRLNKTIDLSAYVGQILKFKVSRVGGSSTSFKVLVGSSGVIGSAFQYDNYYSYMISPDIVSIIFYGSSTENGAATFNISIEVMPNYGLDHTDKKMFFSDKNYEIEDGYYYNTNNSTLANSPTAMDNAGCASGPIRGGDVLAVRGNGVSQYVGLYAFYDKDRKKIYSGGNSYLANRNEIQVFAPEGSAFFAFNTLTYNADTDSVKVRSVLIFRDAIDDLRDKVDLLYPTLFAGKTIVCFGDSQTEYSDQYGKRYADYLADYTGANVVCVGIGGTRLSCRATPTATPTSSVDGYADLDCPSLIDAVSTNDFTIVDAGAEWVRDNAGDDNTPIIARLKAIDWTKVDAVTFLIGTNDWGSEANIGTSGEINKRTVFGAINYIISTLLSAYPNINIYWFTPIVRWITPWTDENWGGTMQKAGKTLEQFVELIKTEVENQNIPVCDMYHTLGWNKYNFEQYFYSTDGTHPTKGYFNIGRKIASFISANRSF